MNFLNKYLIYSFFIVLLSSFKSVTTATVNKEEAKLAFEFLNKVRTQPQLYYQSLRLNPQIKITKKALIWNDTLAKVAEQKALDMASRNYFSHINPQGYGINYFIQKSGYLLSKDWTKNKSDNFFESIGAGIENGEDAITKFIIDSNEPSFGHRNHMLGITDWYGSLKDIGIGFVESPEGSDYDSYICVIIAKHP